MDYAHSRNDLGERQDLAAHLKGVSELSASHAEGLGTAELGRFVGLWHDVGKFSAEFQRYLLASESNPRLRGRGPDHKAAGALMASKYGVGLAAIALQAHHGGLKSPAEFQRWLQEKGSGPGLSEAIARAGKIVPELARPSPVPLPAHILRDPLAAEFFLRMLFSALVDADFLDTEGHLRADASLLRGSTTSIEELWNRFDSHHQQLPKPATAVNEVRKAIYDHCLAAAELPPGLFRLTVPTGGGKTLSGMAFALKHALRHGLRRVVVAVPFISITEQTADVYRSIFGSGAEGRTPVLEHHSAAFDGEAEGDDFNPDREWQRLSAENWDAPIVVTTTVQLFESLFASSTSRCRKLHRLARSVIILDEAQALPPGLLDPILDALQELCRHYGTTVVISTATQPAFESIPVFERLPAREIVPDPERFFNILRRVGYEWRTDPALSWEEVAEAMAEHPRALAIVNTKKSALALMAALGDPDALHLSTLLCGAHRRRVLEEVRRRLAKGEPCRLVSTQVVEAGVDLDFPVVLRAMGPLDGIIQAAGRCNREGKLHRGKVVVFQPQEGGLPKGSYSVGAGITASLLGSGPVDPDDPRLSQTYFRRLFDMMDTDREGVQRLRRDLNYPEVGRRFRLISDDTESVAICCYGSEEERTQVRKTLDRLYDGKAEPRGSLRSLQPYLISVRRREAERHRRQGLLTQVLPGLGVWHGRYDPVVGLTGEGPDPDDFVI